MACRALSRRGRRTKRRAASGGGGGPCTPPMAHHNDNLLRIAMPYNGFFYDGRCRVLTPGVGFRAAIISCRLCRSFLSRAARVLSPCNCESPFCVYAHDVCALLRSSRLCYFFERRCLLTFRFVRPSPDWFRAGTRGSR
jgi:hypothetical protein